MDRKVGETGCGSDRCFFKIFFVLFFGLSFVGVESLWAVRLKDLVSIRGVRENQLVGYGVVVGLKGTGDSALEFTNKSVYRMLDKLGVKLDNRDVASKNVAAVIVTAQLPPFARAGNKVDVTVNSIGDAASLKGGTLVQTPLRAADQKNYAVAQGSLLVGGDDRDAHLTVGSVPNGGLIERDMGGDFSQRKMFRLTLHQADFTTAARIAKTVNLDLAGKYATAKDAATIDVVVPYSYEGKVVELLAAIENLDVYPDSKAKVVINQKTGTVVIGEGVMVSEVAISHGDLSLKVGQPSAKKEASEEKVGLIPRSTSVGELVKAMNQLGVSAKDLVSILQSLKAAGALQGELEIL